MEGGETEGDGGRIDMLLSKGDDLEGRWSIDCGWREVEHRLWMEGDGASTADGGSIEREPRAGGKGSRKEKKGGETEGGRRRSTNEGRAGGRGEGRGKGGGMMSGGETEIGETDGGCASSWTAPGRRIKRRAGRHLAPSFLLLLLTRHLAPSFLLLLLTRPARPAEAALLGQLGSGLLPFAMWYGPGEVRAALLQHASQPAPAGCAPALRFFWGSLLATGAAADACAAANGGAARTRLPSDPPRTAKRTRGGIRSAARSTPRS
jgi:hypothetical protein